MPVPFRASLLPLLVLLTGAACAADLEGEAGRAVGAAAPALGRADGLDAADRSCRVVLRELTRLPSSSGEGYAVSCRDGECDWVWTGHVDVSLEAFPPGTPVSVLYHVAGDPTWWEVPATPASSGRPGYASHVFELGEHLFGPDATDVELAAARIELVPFVRLEAGGRLFDHNRRPGDLDSYVLASEQGFSLGDEPVCQPVVGTLLFQEGWHESTGGRLHAGSWLSIQYDLDRLPECRGTHNGHPAWDLVAHVRFLPGGQLASGSVRELVSINGRPTNEAHERALDLRIPADATSVELWFHNYTGAGSSCQAWDSRYGENYRFDVLPAVDDARCRDTERWTRIYGGEPTCTPYVLAEQHDADHCEVAVSGVGQGYEGHYGIPFEWLEVYLTTGPTEGEVLDAGLAARYRDSRDGAPHELVSLGTRVDGRTFKTGLTYRSTAVMSLPGFLRSIERLAFFVDVRRPSGDVVRLWQSRHGADYTWEQLFDAGTTTQSIAYGWMQWANQGASVLEASRACR